MPLFIDMRSLNCQKRVCKRTLLRLPYRYSGKARLLVVVSLATLGLFAGQGEGLGGTPCFLQYTQHDLLEWNSNLQEKSRYLNGIAHPRFVPDCTGITIKKGKVTAWWKDEHGNSHEAIFGAITTLNDAIFRNALSSLLPTGFYDWFYKFVSNLCGQCSAKHPAGARGTANDVAQILGDAFSGVVVVGSGGIELPLSVAELCNVTAFRIIAADISHRVVEGVAFERNTVHIASRALVGGKSYIWEVEIQEAGGPQSYHGQFEVADDALTQLTVARLDDARKLFNGQVGLRQEAAFYFEQNLPSNATIALIQWLHKNSEER